MLVSGTDCRRRDPSDSSFFNFIVAPWHPLQFLRCYICFMLAGIMLKLVQAHTSTMETQQVSVIGNLAHDCALPVKLKFLSSQNVCVSSCSEWCRPCVEPV